MSAARSRRAQLASASPAPSGSPRLRVGLAGVAIVFVVAALDTLRETLKFIFGESPNPLTDVLRAGWQVAAQDLAIGGVVMIVIVFTRNRWPGHGVGPYVTLFGAIAAATAIALVASDMAMADPGETWNIDDLWAFVPAFVRYALLGSLIAGAWLYLGAESERAAQTESIAVDAATMAEQVTEARLRMLEAQIEPHFLFNTLANVQRLYETDHDTGERMLLSLKAYLGIALPQMREEKSTLRREFAHVRAYLEIQSIRMGRRLAYAVAAPVELESASVPPLMVLTLVENAVKHGLAPTRSGGRIDVRATRSDNALAIVVADTGQGFTATKGAGTGLANTRTRLRVCYGGAANLALTRNSPTGVIATLTFPYADLRLPP